jgi:hypothetical protein
MYALGHQASTAMEGHGEAMIEEFNFSDPRYLEAIRLLLKREAYEVLLPGENPGDEIDQRVKRKIALRVKQRNSKRKRI